jgi:hypothetical protein
VLQQATVHDLRAAIKPQMIRPLSELQVNLSPQFQDENLNREGLVDTIPLEADSFRGNVKVSPGTKDEGISGGVDVEDGKDQEGNEDDMVGATRWQKEKKRKEKLLAEQHTAQKPITENEPPPEGAQKAPKTGSVKDTSKPLPEEKPLSRAERRKKIKDEIIASGQGEAYTGYRRRMW